VSTFIETPLIVYTRPARFSARLPSNSFPLSDGGRAGLARFSISIVYLKNTPTARRAVSVHTPHELGGVYQEFFRNLAIFAMFAMKNTQVQIESRDHDNFHFL
jgi:hypothetical protein